MDKIMKPDGSPRSVFGTMLRHYRTKAGMTPEQLASRTFVSGSLVRKIEDGTRTPAEAFVTACEDMPELHTDGALSELYRSLENVLKPHAYPAWFADWADKEAQAVKFRWFELNVVPGLLQTDAYARALLTDRIGFNGDVGEVVAARMARQAILNRDDPPELFVVIDEAALHRPVGSPDVVAGQLKRLVEMAARPTTILRVIPAETGVHDGLPGPFIIADFTDAPSAAYVDSPLRGIVVQDTEDVTALAGTWDRLTAEALPRSASAKLIEGVAKEWTK